MWVYLACVHTELSAAYTIKGDVCARFGEGKIQISVGLGEFVLQNWYSLSFGSPVLAREQKSAPVGAAGGAQRQ